MTIRVPQSSHIATLIDNQTLTDAYFVCCNWKKDRIRSARCCNDLNAEALFEIAFVFNGLLSNLVILGFIPHLLIWIGCNPPSALGVAWV